MFFSWLFSISLIIPVFTIRGDLYIFANDSVGRPIVSTTSGKFSGFTIRKTNVWIGIPYVAPPIGELRWQKPQPYVLSDHLKNTIQNATHYSPWCPQVAREGFFGGISDEDCLYLNVWAPRIPSTSSKGYPVMIWVHGSGFQESGSTVPIYDGLDWTNDAMENKNSFIMVSFNYRLNAMGFFAHPALKDENGKMIANQGISDQRAAIKWVRENIARFGGDKDSITLMGESAGSQSICMHIVSPLSYNLFRGAILDSGPCDTMLFLRDLQFAQSTAIDLAKRIGCNMANAKKQLSCLMTINSTILVAAIGNVTVPESNITAFKNQQKNGWVFPFSVIVDEVELPVHPLKAFLTGNFNRKISVLIGANRDEWILRVLYDGTTNEPINEVDYLNRFLPIATYNNTEVMNLYTPDKYGGNYSRAYVALMSQAVFICGARRMAGYMVGQPTYLYSYDHTLQNPFFSSSDLVAWPGAFHLADLFVLFQTLSNSLFGNDMFTVAELNLTTSMRNYWTGMITKGQPNDKNSLNWPRYSSKSDIAIVCDTKLTTASYNSLYPNCDKVSALYVKIFGDYLGLDSTCIAGNKCFTTRTNYGEENSFQTDISDKLTTEDQVNPSD